MFVLPKPGEQFKKPSAAMNAPTDIPPGFVFIDVFLDRMGYFHLMIFLNMKNISLAI
jgi:hypothetical protein